MATSPLPLEEVMARLDRVIAGSPCDETELVWIENVRAQAEASPRRPPPPPHTESTVLVRVREGSRVGTYRTNTGDPGELAHAVRLALSHSRIALAGPWTLPPAVPEERVEASPELLDRTLATLEPEPTWERLRAEAREGERALLRWSVGRVLIANSLGLRQQAAATCATLDVRCRAKAGAGRAAASGRSLSDLALEAIFERARTRSAPEAPEPAAAPSDPVPLVLAPEATIALLGLLARHALSTSSFHGATSFLRQDLDRRVFDPALTLVDDATSDQGLPFPFDLVGRAKRPVELILDGTFKTPAIDAELSGSLDRPITPHALTLDDSRPDHLLLRPGELGTPELLAGADGGVWIGWLNPPTWEGGDDGAFRGLARGVRRIRDGALAEGLPDLVWEDTLRRVLSEPIGIGRDLVRLAGEDGFWGGTAAPALALASTAGLHPTRA